MATNIGHSNLKSNDILSSVTNGLNCSSTSASALSSNLNEMLINNKISFEQWPKEKKFDKLSSYSACQVTP